MNVLAQLLVALVALLHLGFLTLEMVLWTKPIGRQVFGLDREFAEQSQALAANQGLYNGFLAAGLVWGLVRDDTATMVFFLLCVVVAGVFGAMTVSQQLWVYRREGRRILLVQALPALLALGAVLLAR